jgi:hypothetical protein
MRARTHSIGLILISLGLAACSAQDDGAETRSDESQIVQIEDSPEAESTPSVRSDEAVTTSAVSESPEATGDDDAILAVPAARVFGVGTSCTRNSCRNGGRCVEQWLGYTCSCPAGFTGTQCETATSGGGRCGNGVIDSGEACDPRALFTNPWTCSAATCTRQTIYTGCTSESQCSSGENCFLGVCTRGCSNAAQCPGTSPGIRTCAGGMLCLTACSSSSQCAPGLVCEPSLGACVGCADGRPCPSGTTCQISAEINSGGVCR